MKKVLSLILAVAMVLSLASIAFATEWTPKSSSSTSSTAYAPVLKYDNTEYFKYDKDDHFFTRYSSTDKVTFGTKVYFPLLASLTDGSYTTDTGVELVEGTYAITADEKAISSLTLGYVIEEGEAFVESISIVKKFGYISNSNDDTTYYVKAKNDSPRLYSATNDAKKFDGYYIEVVTKGSATADKYISGVISLSGKTGSAKLKDEAVHFDLKLYWPTVTKTDNSTATQNVVKLIDDDKTYLVSTDISGKEVKFTNTTDTNKQDFTFTVDMISGEKTTIKYCTDAVEAIEEANEEAGISFFNFYGASFKRAGTLLFPADMDEEDVYFYEVLADGSLKNLTATYDSEETAFSLKVKKLGQYCVSDLPLVDAEGTVAAVAGAVNPTTGAIA